MDNTLTKQIYILQINMITMHHKWIGEINVEGLGGLLIVSLPIYVHLKNRMDYLSLEF